MTRDLDQIARYLAETHGITTTIEFPGFLQATRYDGKVIVLDHVGNEYRVGVYEDEELSVGGITRRTKYVDAAKTDFVIEYAK